MRHRRCLHRWLGYASSVLGAATASAQSLQTAAASRAYAKASSCTEIRSFLAELTRQSHGARIRLETYGRSAGGRDLVAARVTTGAPDADRLRVLVLAGTNAGDAEGSEAAQVLLGRFATGKLDDLLEHLDLLVIPAFDADGAEAIDPANLDGRDGPPGGVGARQTSAGHQLEFHWFSPRAVEMRALQALVQRFDPHFAFGIESTADSFDYVGDADGWLDPDLLGVTRETFVPGLRPILGTKAAEAATASRSDSTMPKYFAAQGRVALVATIGATQDFGTRVRVACDALEQTLRAAARRTTLLREACLAAQRPRPAGTRLRFDDGEVLLPEAWVFADPPLEVGAFLHGLGIDVEWLTDAVSVEAELVAGEGKTQTVFRRKLQVEPGALLVRSGQRNQRLAAAVVDPLGACGGGIRFCWRLVHVVPGLFANTRAHPALRVPQLPVVHTRRFAANAPLWPARKSTVTVGLRLEPGAATRPAQPARVLLAVDAGSFRKLAEAEAEIERLVAAAAAEPHPITGGPLVPLVRFVHDLRDPADEAKKLEQLLGRIERRKLDVHFDCSNYWPLK